MGPEKKRHHEKKSNSLRGQKEEVLRRTDTEKLEETAHFRTLSKPVPTGTPIAAEDWSFLPTCSGSYCLLIQEQIYYLTVTKLCWRAQNSSSQQSLLKWSNLSFAISLLLYRTASRNFHNKSKSHISLLRCWFLILTSKRKRDIQEVTCQEPSICSFGPEKLSSHNSVDYDFRSFIQHG